MEYTCVRSVNSGFGEVVTVEAVYYSGSPLWDVLHRNRASPPFIVAFQISFSTLFLSQDLFPLWS